MKKIILSLLLSLPILLMAQEFNFIKDLKGHSSGVEVVAFSLDGKSLFSGDKDGNIFVWDFKKGKIKRKLKGHTDGVRSITFNTLGSKMVSSSNDGTVKVWDAFKYKLLYSFDYPDLKHAQEYIEPSFALYVPNNRDVYFGGNTIKLYVTKRDNKKIALVYKGQQNITAAVLAPDEEYLVFSEGNAIKYLALNTNTVENEFVIKGDNERSIFVVQGMKFIDEGKQLLIWRSDKQVTFWDVENGKEISTFPVSSGVDCSVFDFSSNEKYLLTGNYFNAGRIWFNSAEKFLIKNLKAHEGPVMSIKMSPDDKYVVTGSKDNLIKVWGFSTGVK
jgi:WD40 repeat protein